MIVNRDHHPIIEKKRRSSLTSCIERIISFILTWLLWYVLLDSIINKLMVEFPDRTLATLKILGIIVVVILLIGGLWQFYNWFLYHGKDRRRAFPRQPMGDIGRLYGISDKDMHKLQEIRSAAVIRFENGRYYYCIKGSEPIEVPALQKKK